MKFLLSILTFLSLFQVQDYPSVIEWTPKQKLKLTDFKAAVDSKSTYLALSNCGIQYEIKFLTDSIFINVFAVFTPNKSWIKEKSDKVLNHEQGHFDICERKARILRQQILSYTDRIKKENIEYLVETLHKDIEESINQNQSIYESSINDERIQEYWDKLIKSDLEKLKEYSNPIIKIKIK